MAVAAEDKIASKHWTLFKLRAKLSWRRYSKQKGYLVAVVISIIFILPFVLAAAGGSWFGYTNAPDQWPAQIFGLILITLWLFWIVFPLLATSLSEGISIDQLMQYPLSARDIVLGMTLGTLLDWQTYFAFPLFIAALIGFGMQRLVLVPLVLLACVIGLGLMIVSSQLLLTMLGGILQSRRARDVVLILASAGGFICWIGTQAMGNVAERLTKSLGIEGEQAVEFMATFHPLDTLKWLPPGALGQSLHMATLDRWGMAFVWILYAVVWLLGLAWLWGKLVFRLTTGGGYLIQLAPRAEKPKKPAKTTAAGKWEFGWMRKLVSAETHQLMLKELRMLWRVPQRRLVTIQALVMPIVIGGFSALNAGIGSSPANIPSFVVAIAMPLYVLFTFWMTGQNMLGWEHSGLPSLLITPVARKHIFRGKSIALIMVNVLPLLVIGALFATATGQPIAYLWVALGILTVLPMLAVQSVTSAYFPMPVKLDFKTNKSSFTSGGCIGSLAMITIVPFSSIMLNVPLLVPGLVYYLASGYSWLVIPLVPLVIAYAFGIWYVATAWAGSILTEREPEVIGAARPLDSD